MGNKISPQNKIIFPSPNPTYTKSSERLRWIPKEFDNPDEREHIPCMYVPALEPSAKIQLYFHGNAEDIGVTQEFMQPLSQEFDWHFQSIEYPGYGLYEGFSDSDQIKEDCHTVIKFLVNKIGFKVNNILVFGRSLGSGPATFVASEYDVAALLLFSPFTGIVDAAVDQVGFLGNIVTERFDNLKCIKDVKAPTWLLHGKEDEIISYNHSIKLKDNTKTFTVLNLQDNMTHNYFDLT